ncbi:DUF6624 domain-containing protein [Xanthomonas campestris pv. raphani]|uniref:DUF6624 domain-containing protein n=1 Tax=Xanthomonas campestris TaxID=339 RepID=UPI002B22DBFC|nr:DUF6624 domain-containing protein [Xanthomonas campestris]MEA9655305.1 DUF6624 domain-containing protein [Xanthomonas campestris pv. raphani]
MRICHLLFGFCMSITLAAAAHADAQPDFKAAVDAYQAQDYARCAEILGALQGAAIPFPSNGELLYAECLAAAGQTDQALRYLDNEMPSGRIAVEDLRSKDRPGLNRLRTTAGWPALLAKAEHLSAQQTATVDQPLRNELLARVEQDQRVRHAAIAVGGKPEDWVRTAPVDRDNTAWLKQVIARKGWPGRSLVGEDGANAAWTLVQHADADLAFQEQALKLMEAALTRRDVAPSEVALLTDRVLVGQNKPQRYGTQFKAEADGSMALRPTEDIAGLEGRRRAVGLPPMAEYRQTLLEGYRVPVR